MTWIDYRTAKTPAFSRKDFNVFPEKSTLVLSSFEKSIIEELAQSITANPYNLKQQEDFVISVKKLGNHCFKESRDFITEELNHGFGAVLIKGLPTDQDLPNTPAQGGSISDGTKTTYISEAILLALGMTTGSEPFNFRQEGRGTAPLIDNIVPVKHLKSQKGAGGFDNNFPFHCESAWHRKRPDYLVLLGLREASDAKTLIFSSNMLKNTRWETESVKMKNSFRLKAPDLYVQMQNIGLPIGTENYSNLAPISLENGGLIMNINFNGTDCKDMASVGWLSELEDFIEEQAVGAVISPGNAIILNNYRTCHTRTSFSPTFNGMDRWFQRAYFKKDLWQSNDHTEQRETFEKELIEDLINTGWMTKDLSLTAEFMQYVYHPEHMKGLEGYQAKLAAVAVNFTPIAGSRIV